ncbi:MAG: (Fe-S)-binding protein [Deltaproteobacteria bacterium]|nr:(Fe-S)-binding protein [Deltaproteobacteria bacterium]
MTALRLTEPDLDFIKELQKTGGESLKKCFQCATCSVVCQLSPDNNPFPRKEMIWAQWGQKERLVSDHHVWLCHQCNDCSTNCPRGARPGDVLAAVRAQSIRHYSIPGFMTKIVQDPKLILVALAIPVLYVLAMLGVDGHLSTLIHPPKAEVEYGSYFLSHLTLNIMFTSAFVIFLLGGLVGLTRFINDMKKTDPIPGDKDPGFIKAVIAAFFELLAHRKFKKCTAGSNRYFSHFGLFYGFALLFIVTSIVVLLILVAPDTYPINSLSNPLKLAGNLGAILLIGGGLIAIYDRLTTPDLAGQSSYFDWFFLLVILTVGITGLLTEIARFTNASSWAYWMYFFHIVFVFCLLCYLPYSKFGHLLYRFFAIVHSKRVGGYPE